MNGIMLRLSSCALALLVSSAAFAAGDAGCGLGSIVMQRNSKLSQTLAATTNGTLLSQVFGITSGTSNCSSSQLVYNEHEAAKFAEANIEGLRVDFARGEGENLVAFSQLMGCGSSSTEFGQMTRAHYGEIFSSGSVGTVELIQNVKKQIQSAPTLASSCQAV